jgi:hypothetical protein
MMPDAVEQFNVSVSHDFESSQKGRLNHDDVCLSHSAEPPLVEPPKFNHE